MMANRTIGVFCYKRANKLKRCIDALLANPECSTMNIVFFSDGFKGDTDRAGVMETRDYIDSLSGFKNVIKHYRERNYSTGPNFRSGLEFLNSNYDEYIIVEDDLIVSPNYLSYLLQALDFYRAYKSVFCITGYVYPIRAENYAYDTVVYKRFCSYGWAGWSNRFTNVVWEEIDLQRLIKTSPGFKKRLNAEGHDLMRMLNKQIDGTISTWDVQLQVHVAENRLNVIYPILSKVDNIGFDEESTNTFGLNFLVTPIDDGRQQKFNFCPPDLFIPTLQRQIKKPFAFGNLVYRKIVNTYIKMSRQIKKVN